ncbi:glycosyltransferase family 4 protein [Flavobacterium sp. GP15]|uniref:glycosyltransferase family 4 protein n=1 Tax=Flavobacterium sp. GP15 TaxID=2758567 RepID=UPI00165DD4D3|nr:glycosyltransferase family 4 protein [Flavobacterium sp. GP15]
MRIIQLIDSLEAGGAERMAVSYANALSKEIEFSGLIATRKQGPLVNLIEKEVAYFFLNRKSTLDIASLFRLRSYIKNNNITIVQAHSSSFFLAFLLKLIYPRVQLIWHDHYGNSEFLSKRPTGILRAIIPFFSGVVVVNHNLKDWCKQRLKIANIIFLPNFVESENKTPSETILKGIAGKRIVCLANLRSQKNHYFLIEVAKKLKFSHPDWTFHLVGKDFLDDYSREIKALIVASNLEKKVFLYGSKQDVGNIIDQASICILTSKSEGLPVSLLEYGLHKKPVVVTNVGDVSTVIQKNVNGFLVESDQIEVFYDSIVKLIANDKLQIDFGLALYKTIVENYSEESVIKIYINWLQNSCK